MRYKLEKVDDKDEVTVHCYSQRESDKGRKVWAEDEHLSHSCNRSNAEAMKKEAEDAIEAVNTMDVEKWKAQQIATAQERLDLANQVLTELNK